MSRISDEELRRLLNDTTPGPWRLGADLTTVNTAYGGDADFVKGGWAKAIAKTTLPKWMPPKQAWPNGQLIALAPALAAEVLKLREAIRSAVCEYENSREDAADVSNEMFRILGAVLTVPAARTGDQSNG